MYFRRAFSMLELVFVIVIIGILGKFGVELLANSYQQYIQSEIASRQAAESAYAVEFIAKRLEYRIKESVIVRKSADFNDFDSLEGHGNDTHEVLEWVGYDIEGLRGLQTTPLWSGIFNKETTFTTPNEVFSPATDTSQINTLISILSYGSSGINDAALFMMGDENDYLTGYGWNGNPVQDINQSMKAIQSDANVSKFLSNVTLPSGAISGFNTSNLINLDNQTYKLAWSAYAVVFDTTTNQLLFYYDYQPWNGDRYTDGRVSIIMNNVSTFLKGQEAKIMRIVVCTENQRFGDAYSVCKEKTIL